MITVKSVTIEGFHNVRFKTYQFDQNFIYLHGLNGAGKSTVLQAIQLALLGYIPGTDKNKTAIFSHSSSKHMAIRLVLDDNNQDIIVERSWTAAGGNIIAEVTVQPSTYDIESLIKCIELPIFNFAEFIGMTANKLKDWFIEFLPSSEFHTDWSTELRDSAVSQGAVVSKDVVDSLVYAIQELNASGVEEIRQANSLIKLNISSLKQDLQRTTNTVQSLIYHEDVNGVNKDTLEAELSDANISYQYAIRYSAINEANQDALKLLETYSNLKDKIDEDNVYTENRAACERLREEVCSLNSCIEEQTREAAAVELQLANATTIAEGSNVCPYTSEPCQSIIEAVSTAKTEVARLSNTLDQINEQIATNKQLRSEYEEEIQSMQIVIDDLSARYAERDRVKSTLRELPEHITEADMDVEFWAGRIKDLQDTKLKLIANDQYSSLIDKLTVEKFRIAADLEAYKVWDKLTGVNGLQSKNGGDDPFAKLISSMQPTISALFGKDVETTFYTTGKSNSFSFGITRDGSYITFDHLSSGEKCLYVLALLISITQMSPSGLKLILIDDLFDHLDTANIEKVFESLLNMSDIQMIFAGVNIPSNENINKHTIEIGDAK